jgi:serine phosphatase RsbU (regulator of sigma subunit)
LNSGTTIRTANVRGALVLGGLLLAILLAAVAISIRIYTQLESAARLQRVLVAAQRQLDDIVNSQLDQETRLRGYLATNDRVFLGPYVRGVDPFEDDLALFAKTTQGLSLPDVDASVLEMRKLHDSWVAEVEEPLLRAPHDEQAIARETLGKVLIDQLAGDTANIRGVIEAQLTQAQAQLRQRIDQALIGGLASVLIFGCVSILFVSSRVQMQAVIDRERSIVETLERAFRTDLDVLPGSRIGTAYLSADLDAAVGGDLYDVRHLDETHGLVLVADVSGKGITAAVNTAFVKYSVRTLAREHRDPADILNNFNAIFLETVADPNLFVVVFVGVLDAKTHELSYASAGHSGAFLRRGNSVRQLAVTGPVIGLDKSFTYETIVLPLAEGDLLLLATDGLTEARDGEGAFLDESGAMALLRDASLDPQRCADEMVAAVRERGGGTVGDDLALLAIAIDGKVA